MVSTGSRKIMCWTHAVHAVSFLRNLGVIMDFTMDMHSQIQSVKCAMFHHLRTISNIRRFLVRDTCVKAVLSSVMSRVDYCNCLLVGQSAAALRGLQLAQKYAARLVMGLPRCDHVNSSIGGATLAANSPASLLQTDVPPSQDPVHRWRTSLHELLGQPTPGRALRSATAAMRLTVPRTQTARIVWLEQTAASRVSSCSLGCAASSPPSLFDTPDF